MDDDTKSMIKKQFDIAYYGLQELHGVKLGSSYRNRQSCTLFVEIYIALEQMQILASSLEKVNFFSIQVDGSCDSANLEEESFIAL